jgi:PAS domain S-box-containing protein
VSKILNEILARINALQPEELEEAKKDISEQLLKLNKEIDATQFKYQRSAKEKNIIYSLLNKTSQDLNQALISLKIRAEELSTLLSAIPAFVYFKNLELEYQMVNKTYEVFLQVNSEDIKGKKLNELLPEYNSIEYETHEKELLATGLPKYGIEEVIMKDEAKIWLSTNIAPVKNNQGQVIGLVGVSNDITERKNYEIELTKAKELAEAGTKSKSEFLANVSHEIRTPMNGIIGMADILKQTPLSEEQLQHLQAVESSAGSLLSLINDVLDFSKIEAGKLDFEIISFKLNDVLWDVRHILSNRAGEKGLEFNIDCDGTIPGKLKGDPNRLKQIILNLANNAIKFTEKGHVHIFISTLAKNDHETTLKFEVKDTGIGISKEGQSRLFKEFSQVDASTTRKFGGTGLGLSISKKLCEMMNGKIGVESQFGRGSNFWFTADFQVPDISEEPENHENDNQIQDFMAKLEHNLSVLLVEDNVINQKIARFNLEKAGYKVDIAETGHDAVIKFKNGNYDVILMDVLMPVMNGFKATQIIRAMEAYRNKRKGTNKLPIPIIALTANAMKGDREACLAAGMNNYISKPFKHQDLVEALRNIFQ